jgi:hypothetical protein
MEWFIPSILVLVLSAIVCFMFLPKWSPYTLGLLSFALFFVGIWQHYSMFPYEYKNGSAGSSAQDYAPFIMIGGVILAGIIGISVVRGGSGSGPSVVAIANSIPGVASLTGTPANKGTSIFGNNTKNASIASSLGLGNRKNNIASNSFKTV